MNIIHAKIFKKFPLVNFGFSPKLGYNRPEPFYFNMSLTVGDDESVVKENREVFFNKLGLTTDQIALQRQIHSEKITVVEEPGNVGESDALITTKTNIGLAISAADCTPIFIYDCSKQIVAGVHSGWRGTKKQIVLKTLQKLENDFNSKVADLYIYVGPSISQKNYEVGLDVADLFNAKYVQKKDGRLFLNVLRANVDMIEEFGVPNYQIEVSQYCSYQEKDLFHSFRRDGNNSGRHLGVISLKGV